MLIDTEALVRHASAVKTQADEVRAVLVNHRAELQKAKEHFMARHKAAVELAHKDQQALVDGITALQNELDEAIAKIAGQEPWKPEANKEPSDGESQEG